jgi:hypothetical protein
LLYDVDIKQIWHCFCQVIRRSIAIIVRQSLHGLVNASLKREQIEHAPQLEVSSQSLLGTVEDCSHSDSTLWLS